MENGESGETNCECWSLLLILRPCKFAGEKCNDKTRNRTSKNNPLNILKPSPKTAPTKKKKEKKRKGE